MDNDNKKPFKIKDIQRVEKKAVVAASLEEMRLKASERFDRPDELPAIHLDSDGTEIDDEEYFRTLDDNTELIAVFPGEHWIDPTRYMAISSRHENGDLTDSGGLTDTARLKELVGQLQSNLCNVSVIGQEPDLESLSNMDPNSLVDITGKDFMDQLKDSGRPLCAKRNAQDRINLLKLLKDGAIFCSERYPEEAEAIDMEISRQMQYEIQAENGGGKGMAGKATPIGVAAAAAAKTATVGVQQNNMKAQQQQQSGGGAASPARRARPPPHIVVNSAESCDPTNLNAANERRLSQTIGERTSANGRLAQAGSGVGAAAEKRTFEDI